MGQFTACKLSFLDQCKNLHFYVKKNEFQVLDMPSLGVQNFLVLSRKDKEVHVTTFVMLFIEDLFGAIKEVHDKVLLHAGYHKTYEKVFSFQQCILYNWVLSVTCTIVVAYIHVDGNYILWNIVKCSEEILLDVPNLPASPVPNH